MLKGDNGFQPVIDFLSPVGILNCDARKSSLENSEIDEIHVYYLWIV